MTITIRLTTGMDAKIIVLRARLQDELRAPRFSCSCQVSGTQHIHNSDNRKMTEGCLVSCFGFPNFRKVRKTEFA